MNTDTGHLRNLEEEALRKGEIPWDVGEEFWVKGHRFKLVSISTEDHTMTIQSSIIGEKGILEKFFGADVDKEKLDRLAKDGS